MATLAQKIQCEHDAREMIREQGLPEPDAVEYGQTCVRLFWEKSKVVLVVDIDKPADGFHGPDRDDEDLDYDEMAEELERLDRGGDDEEDDMD